MNNMGPDSHDTYPIEYDEEVDPDPELLDLQRDVARLQAMLKYWSMHLNSCPRNYNAWPSPCTCRLNEALDGTLWDMVGDSENLQKALDSLDE